MTSPPCYGKPALGVLDDWVGTLGFLILAMVQILCFGRAFGMDRGWREAHAHRLAPVLALS